MKATVVRPLLGLAMIAVIVAIVAVAVVLFQGGLTASVPVTVISQRAGLVMNNDADVKMRGVPVGKVDSIEQRPDGTAALHLAMNPSQLHLIPDNVLVHLAAPTVFGAKYVQMVAPDDPSSDPLEPGDVIDAQNVTVEINTVFEQLTQVLSEIEPGKLNETLGAIATAFSGRGEKFGQMLSDLEEFLAKIEPSLPALSHDLEVAPDVLDTYADATPDLIDTVRNATQISQSIVEEQDNLDVFLLSAIGLADIGNEVIGDNREALTNVLEVLVPTTELLNKYDPTLTCTLNGIAFFTKQPPLPEPGVLVSVSLPLGIERYRYPTNLPQVHATGGPNCKESMLTPSVPFNEQPPYIVTDNGTNPMQYGNPGILLNSDGLKQLLYGPIAGPPRNTMQIGMPG